MRWRRPADPPSHRTATTVLPADYFPKEARQLLQWHIDTTGDHLVRGWPGGVGKRSPVCATPPAGPHPWCLPTAPTAAVGPALLLQIRDRPAWFVAFIYFEIFVQLPFFFVAAYAYATGAPRKKKRDAMPRPCRPPKHARRSPSAA